MTEEEYREQSRRTGEFLKLTSEREKLEKAIQYLDGRGADVVSTKCHDQGDSVGTGGWLHLPATSLKPAFELRLAEVNRLIAEV